MKSIIQGIINEESLNISKDYAIMYLGGNINLYYKTNQSFIDNCSTLGDEILNQLNVKHYEGAYLLIHRIKGIACYIGSKELYDYSDYLCSKIKRKDYNIDDDINLYCIFLNKIIEYKKKENELYLNDRI